jgi:hypothetical protein
MRSCLSNPFTLARLHHHHRPPPPQIGTPRLSNPERTVQLTLSQYLGLSSRLPRKPEALERTG